MPPPAPHPAPTGRDRTPGEPEAGPGAAFFVGQAGASRRKYVEPPGEERASDQAGKLEELASLTREIWSTMEIEKPRTLMNLAYINEQGTEVTFLHAFCRPRGYGLHWEGADERAELAYQGD